ncbi:hypothetical protein NE237_000818 [Protea cynaroides]|uniref:Uncharacterized protein n=1 Tax=Protea cynaroides TaxID=273540 RepID=A0A9Q0KRX4_9MAGN|nr:hypothetical protein NE237_000818 [Protea cynaroides]
MWNSGGSPELIDCSMVFDNDETIRVSTEPLITDFGMEVIMQGGVVRPSTVSTIYAGVIPMVGGVRGSSETSSFSQGLVTTPVSSIHDNGVRTLMATADSAVVGVPPAGRTKVDLRHLLGKGLMADSIPISAVGGQVDEGIGKLKRYFPYGSDSLP